ncbi:MAG: PhoH family protein [Bacteroidales bacterium]
MIERVIILENIDPVVFYGVNNTNIQFLKSLYPKLRFVARGHVMKVIGEEKETEDFEKMIRKLEKYCEEFNVLNEEIILDFVTGEKPAEKKQDNLIIHGVNGKPITARTPNQKKLVDAFDKNDLVFALGPAGSGKTYVAIALAVKAYKNREIKKIILSRPAVEAGEKLGFLPGEMKDKLDPYLQPLYDALQDMIPAAKLKELLESNVIQIAPLAYMRGRTLSDAVIILDEAQNTTTHQIKMFLTRLGLGGKMIITGDMTQIDLPASVTSGLVQARKILKDVPGIATVEFEKKDIVRHKLVQRIVDAYDKHDDKVRKARLELKNDSSAQNTEPAD